MTPDTPRAWRDPWAWASAASVMVLLVTCVGAHLGEPAAEDFDMLHRALFEPSRSWLDGGGTHAYWRPLAFQAYFGLFGRLMLTHPAGLAFVHALLLALAAGLLYRAFRPHLAGPAAAAVATFPVLAESTRVLLAWPSQFGDLGALLFSALALHEAARRRLPSALGALALALLAKEPAVVTALLLPFLPAAAGGAARPGERRRWIVGCGAVVVVWAAAYAWVRAHAGLELPHGAERDLMLLRTPMTSKLAWAWWNALRAAFGLAAQPAAADARVGLATGALLGLAGVAFATSGAARARLRAARPWIAWGVAWFLLAAAALAPVYPQWAPVRAAFACVGLGLATVLLLRAAHPALAMGLVALRLVLVLGAPGPPHRVTPEPPFNGNWVDFPRIARLQLFLRESRDALRSRYPQLAPGSTIGFRNLPLSTEYAFGGPRAVQAWYGDPTLHWITYAQFEAAPGAPVTALLDYQPDRDPPVALLTPAAVRLQKRGVALLEAGQWAPAMAAFDSAAAAQPDRGAVVFLGDNAGRRAYCLAQLGRFAEAETDARIALAAADRDNGARFVLAVALAARKERKTALAELDTLLARSPGDTDAIALRDRLRMLVSGSAPAPLPGR